MSAYFYTSLPPNSHHPDQGSQFTSDGFTGLLNAHGIKISMDGKGRALDNVFVERLWRSVKYECVYLREFGSVKEAKNALKEYFIFYNNERPHQGLGGKTPRSVYIKIKRSPTANGFLLGLLAPDPGIFGDMICLKQKGVV